MTTASQTVSRPAARPKGAGIPSHGRAEQLERLRPLVGTWDMEASFPAGQLAPGAPACVASGGRTRFEWMDGGAFLIQRFSSGHPDAPSGLAVIGPVTESESAFIQHYYDSRGVARVYHMTMDGDAWTLSREAPGFCQRYQATISPEGTVITGAWESSADGENWEHDFDLTYHKAG